MVNLPFKYYPSSLPIPRITRSTYPFQDGGEAVPATGGYPDASDIECLQREVARLRKENFDLTARNLEMDVELSNLRALAHGGGDGDDEEPAALSDEAQRKRLERVCKRKSDGTL